MNRGLRNWFKGSKTANVRKASRSRIVLEELEEREMLSGSPPAVLPHNAPQPAEITVHAAVLTDPFPQGNKGSPTGGGYTPAQIQSAYGFNQLPTLYGGTYDDLGTGQTIAIVDAYNDPNVGADLQTFDQQFNIGGTADNASDTSFFSKVNEFGASSPLPSSDQTNYGLETALDVEWAHAMAPGANILLVEANSSNTADMNTAIKYAADQPGVSVVSLSFAGNSEYQSEFANDAVFTTPLGHAPVAFIVASGDTGAYFAYPSPSPNLLAVGGTTLPADSSGNPVISKESGWSGSGGGISSVEAQPAYQQGKVKAFSTSNRTIPDVAYDADPNTGFPVYDSLYSNQFGGSTWIQVGGTSAGAPQWAALVAIVDQQRAALNQPALDGANQLLPAIYQIGATSTKYANDFNDITTSDNNFSVYSAGPGYDLVTGFGTPKAQNLIPDLVAYSPPATSTVTWTGNAGDGLWDDPHNWSGNAVPVANNDVVISTSNVTINQGSNGSNGPESYDTIRSLTVTGTNVTLNLNFGTLDLSGSGALGTFQIDQSGDVVNLAGGVLKDALVTSGTTITVIPNSSNTGDILDGVQLNGTLDMSQNSGAVASIEDGLALNGTILLGGSGTNYGKLYVGYVDPNAGQLDHTPQVISGTGTIQVGQGSDTNYLDNNSPLTIGPSITIKDEGQFTIDGLNWTNKGTITVSSGATLNLLGSWTNDGPITGGPGTINLGSPFSGNPTKAASISQYGWTSPGSITIASGSTVNLGGIFTTDAFNQLVAASKTLTSDTVYLTGSLDNSVADNPVSAGTFVLNSTTGPLYLDGGYIYQGTITTDSTTNDLIALSGVTNTLDGVTLNGTLDLTQNASTVAQLINFVDLTASGLIKLDQSARATIIGTAWTNHGTITETGSSILGLFGSWTNDGTITVDPSTISLGSAISISPKAPSASKYYWSNLGTITITEGSTVNLGGVFTTDQFVTLSTVLGDTAFNLSSDTVNLTGSLDNSPADNPISNGVLTLNSATGPLYLAGGYIYQGTISTSGGNDLVATDSNYFNDPFFGYLGGGTLDGVTLDGTLDMTQFVNVEATVLNNLVLNGTIELGGTGSNDATLNFGNPNSFFGNSQTISGSGTIQFGQGSNPDFLYNNTFGTTVSFGSGITIDGGTFSDIFFGTDNLSEEGFDFQAGCQVNENTAGGTLSIHGINWTNEGTITVRNGATLNLWGSWTNSGTITAGVSTISLGGNTFVGNPTDSFYISQGAWSNQGTLTIAAGSTVNLGGFFTTDAFNELVAGGQIQNSDTVNLNGSLDNSPADNPVGGGVLNINATTGPLYFEGYIYHGTINTSGSDDLVTTSNSGGVLDTVVLNGTLDMSQCFNCLVTVNNDLVLNGTIYLGGTGSNGADALFFQEPNFNPATISTTSTGTIQFGQGTQYYNSLGNWDQVAGYQSAFGLTIGPNVTIAGGYYSDLTSQYSLTNQGTIEENTGGGTFIVNNGISGYFGSGLLTNYSAINFSSSEGTLTGGTWGIANGGSMDLLGAGPITTNAATINVSGSGHIYSDQSNTDALAGFNTNAAGGAFNVGSGYSFAAPSGGFSNAGAVTIANGGSFSTMGTDTYTQSGGSTTVDGTLTAATVNLNAGTLTGLGTIVGNLSNSGGTVTPGDAPGTLTVQGNYTQAAGGTLDVNLAGASEFSALVVTGTATLDGALNVDLLGGYTPLVGQSFAVLTFASQSGAFATQNLPKTTDGYFLPVHNSGNLTFVFDAPLSVTSAAQTLSEKVNVSTGSVLLATFQAGSPPLGALSGFYTASVNWQDGNTESSTSSSNVSVVISGTTIEVYGQHTYASAGQYVPAVTLSDAAQAADATTATTTTLTVIAQLLTSTAISATSSTPIPSSFGKLLGFTAMVTDTSNLSITPIGTVTFYSSVNGVTTTLPTVNLKNGVATLYTIALGAGNNTITATYNGASKFTSSTTTTGVSQTVDTANTTLAISMAGPSPSTYGETLTFTATVTDTSDTTVLPIGGKVTLFNGSTKLGIAIVVNGTTKISVATLGASTTPYAITASYSGTSNAANSMADYASVPTTSCNTLSQMVNTATTSTALSVSGPSPSSYGESLAFTATVSDKSDASVTPTGGTVTFFNGSINLGSAKLVKGTANFSTSTLPAGTWTITATYNGTPPSGTANFGPSPPATGVSQTVNTAATSTVISAAGGNPNPSSYGESLTFTATVTDTSDPSVTPTGGTVTFFNGSTTLGSANLMKGTATFSTSTLPPGTWTITATYDGTPTSSPANFGPSPTATGVSQTVNQGNTSTTVSAAGGNPLSPSYGEVLTFTATVSDTSDSKIIPTGGTVTFYHDSIRLGAAVMYDGTATLPTTGVLAGTNSITAIYNGTTNFAASPTSPAITQTVNTANISVSISAAVANPNPSTYGQPLTFTAIVTDTSDTKVLPQDGKVTLYNGSTNLGGGYVINGTATITLTTLAVSAAPYSITAIYGGTTNVNSVANFAVSPTSPALSQTVNTAASTSTGLTTSPDTPAGQLVTFTATITNTTSGSVVIPTGMVTFKDVYNGTTTVLGTKGMINGVAILTTTRLAKGTHDIFAFFANGATNFMASSLDAMQIIL